LESSASRPDASPEKLKTFVVGLPLKNLYVKADARTAFLHVQKLLQAIDAAGIRDSALLSSHIEAVTPGTHRPPKGLEVLVGRAVNGSSKPVVVQLFNSEQGFPALNIHDQSVSLTSLACTLAQVLNKQTGKKVLLKADGQLPFARVIEVVDHCQSAGIKVVLDPGHHTY
jgi:biopolymer transport protein ExbD